MHRQMYRQMCCMGKLPELNAKIVSSYREENLVLQDGKFTSNMSRCCHRKTLNHIFIVLVIYLQCDWSREPKGEETVCLFVCERDGERWSSLVFSVHSSSRLDLLLNQFLFHYFGDVLFFHDSDSLAVSLHGSLTLCQYMLLYFFHPVHLPHEAFSISLTSHSGTNNPPPPPPPPLHLLSMSSSLLCVGWKKQAGSQVVPEVELY